MKKVITMVFAMAVASCGFSQSLAAPPSGNNQESTVTQGIGPVRISITYSSPHVHTATADRTGHIWGELVPYGYADVGPNASPQPWRAGANENTLFTLSHDAKVEGKDLKAGTYALFLAPSKDGQWTWIFSSNHSSWGSFSYKQSEDVLRVDVTPAAAPFTEYLTYGFDERQPSSAVAYLQWENKRIPLKIEVPNVNDIYVSLIRDQLRSTVGFDYRNYAQAASFCAQNKINLEEAMKWADRSTNVAQGGREEMGTYRAKADVLRATGKDAEAEELMKKAITLPTASVGEIHQYGRTLLQAGQKEKAMEVFKYNAQKNLAVDKFTPNVGLARGYTALGDTKNAIKYWEEAIKNIPDAQKANINFYQGELNKLKAAK